ncbi:hypothetical protein HK100_009396 [Physocladia obscura]|uniref:Uncharacterized protein n=1 Tax=Physocladia obscura TaxID=109957 RepID=A0AAD5T3W7_9FUNG|nr:hypothetical protein HK100_009396 [Physocladia obscura]
MFNRAFDVGLNLDAIPLTPQVANNVEADVDVRRVAIVSAGASSASSTLSKSVTTRPLSIWASKHETAQSTAAFYDEPPLQKYPNLVIVKLSDKKYKLTSSDGKELRTVDDVIRSVPGNYAAIC